MIQEELENNQYLENEYTKMENMENQSLWNIDYILHILKEEDKVTLLDENPRKYKDSLLNIFKEEDDFYCIMNSSWCDNFSFSEVRDFLNETNLRLRTPEEIKKGDIYG